MSLDALLRPKSIAVIGASERPSLGRSLIVSAERIGFEGRIYPINPKYPEILGQRCYPSVEELPEAPDVVAFCVGYRRILESFRPLAAKGAKAAAIFDGGFAERGEEGARLQAEIVGICREAGILLNGPNCMGVLNPATRSSIYIQELRDPAGLVGNVGLISQSGSNGPAMSDYHRTVTSSPFGQATGRTTIATDEGLRAYMLHVYNYMVFGLAITGLAALVIYMASVTGDPGAAAKILRNGVEVPARVAHDMYLTSIGYTMFVSPVKWIVILAPLAMVFGLSFGIERLRPATAQLLFWIFAALMGLSLGSIFMVYTHTSIVRVFFITAASFGALSLWGYTTQRDLSGMGSFLLMGLFGIILASLVNLFMASSALQFVISVVGVLVFAGLTAWDTQRLKSEYLHGGMDGETSERSSILGALSLYLNFINIFTLLLQLLGQRDE